MNPQPKKPEFGVDWGNPVTQLTAGLAALLVCWFFLTAGMTPAEKAIARHCFGIVMIAGVAGFVLVGYGNSLPQPTENSAKEFNGGAVTFWVVGLVAAFIYWNYQVQMIAVNNNMGKLFSP